MIKLAQSIVASKVFQNFVTLIIVVAGVLVGIETYPAAVEKYGTVLHTLDAIVLWIFVAEIAIKMVAAWPKPWRFFFDAWNVFDFIIVAAAFLPFGGSAATVLRLVRLLRVLRLLRSIPKLQLLVGALLKSIPSMAYVGILLGLLFYVYAVAAVFMWGENDPVHFDNLQISFVSLFRVVTLEDWTDIMYIQMYGCENYGYRGIEHLCVASTASPVGGAAFFVSFVLLGTMIILNLFIGVILSGMDEAQAEARDEDRIRAMGEVDIGMEIAELRASLNDMHRKLGTIARAAQRAGISDTKLPELSVGTPPNVSE